MNFEEWWEKSGKKDIPRYAYFCDFGKTVAESAWLLGFEEGRKLTTNAADKEPESKDIWTNEDESASIEKQIIEDSCR